MRLKKILRCIAAFFVSGLILYIDILYSFPSEITMYKNEAHNRTLGAGVCIGDIPRTMNVSAENNKVVPLENGQYSASLKLGNVITFKKVSLHVTESKSVYASGNLIGLRIHNSGLIVTDVSSIETGKGTISPAQNAGIQKGDVIIKINGKNVYTSEDVAPLLSENTVLTVLRNTSVKTISVNPARDISGGELKMGVWVRDSTAGVGTMTFFDPHTNRYGALGHGISDNDTGVAFSVQSGTLEKSNVVSVKKGTVGEPGEICGSFSYEDGVCGTVDKNCEAGVFGSVFKNHSLTGQNYEIGVMSQVDAGEASILSTVDNTVKEYKINILRSMPFGSAAKGLVIQITDPELLKKTGGIIQGMSGSPIIQNGKLIGAVTHVFVNDPTRGYGIFIENMLAEAG